MVSFDRCFREGHTLLDFRVIFYLALAQLFTDHKRFTHSFYKKNKIFLLLHWRFATHISPYDSSAPAFHPSDSWTHESSNRVKFCHQDVWGNMFLVQAESYQDELSHERFVHSKLSGLWQFVHVTFRHLEEWVHRSPSQLDFVVDKLLLEPRLVHPELDCSDSKECRVVCSTCKPASSYIRSNQREATTQTGSNSLSGEVSPF